MKKAVNWTLIALMGIVFVWGIIAVSLNHAANNAATYSTADAGYNYASDGRLMQATEVAEENAYRYVQSTDYETITYQEYLNRQAKYYEILMNKAKETYDAEDTDANLRAYNAAKVTHAESVNRATAGDQADFVSTSSNFLTGYLPVIIFLFIALLVNQKVDYNKAPKA